MMVKSAVAMNMSAGQAERELLKLDEEIARREARTSFLQYCRHPDLFPGEGPAAHHEYMIDALERIYRGEIKRLMVLMPPGHAKTQYCSVVSFMVSGQSPETASDPRQLRWRPRGEQWLQGAQPARL